MSPRWFHAVRRILTMKRPRRQKQALYADSDEEGAPSTPGERFTHTDWSHRDNRTSVHTTYHELPPSPNKRPRAASLPSSTTVPSLVSLDCFSSVYDANADVIEELDYLYQQFELCEQQTDIPTTRERTAGVSTSRLRICAQTHHDPSGSTPSSVDTRG